MIEIVTVSIALIALVISGLSYFHSLKASKLASKIESNKILQDARFLFSEASIIAKRSERDYREFWRLSSQHAKLMPNDHEEILDRIKGAITGIEAALIESLNVKSDYEASNNYLTAAKMRHDSIKSFSESMEQNLQSLLTELQESSNMPSEQRILHLQQSVSKIKQWDEAKIK